MASDEQLLRDWRLEPRDGLLPPVFRVADTADDVPPSRVRDVDTVAGRANLGQAITMRLLTPRGDLAALGHPGYGSRIGELLGRPNTATTRGLVRLAVLEALAEERRIAEVLRVDVAAVTGAPHRVRVDAVVMPVTGGEPLRIGPITLEFER